MKPAVLECLKRANIIQVDETWHLKTTDRLSREDYKQFQLIVHGLRGEWVRKLDAHVFQSDPNADLQSMIELRAIPQFVFNPHSFFPTPMSETNEAIELSGLQYWDEARILEPSAGDGRFIRAALKKRPRSIVDYYEIDEKNQQICESLGANLLGSDFLSAPQQHEYDYIFMNPPFNGREYQKHIRKAASWLKNGGVLIAVMTTVAKHDRKFRDWMFGEMNGMAYEMTEAFEDTKISTIMVKMCKYIYPAPDGYRSYPLYITEITLDSDAKFHERVKTETSIEGIARLIESTVSWLNREGDSLACTENDALYLAGEYRPDLVVKGQEAENIEPMQLQLI